MAAADPTLMDKPRRGRGGYFARRFGRAAYRFRRNRVSVVALMLVAGLLLLALVGPLIAPYPTHAEGAIDIPNRLQPPSVAHLFGTDSVGRDNYSRVLIGARTSLVIAFLVILIASGVGTLLGSVAGYAGGILGEAIMRTVDIFMTIPALVLAILISAVLGPSILNTAIAIGIARWPVYARLAFGQVLRAREESYVEAARGIAASPGRILFVHILPNSVSPIVVQASLDVGFAILTTSALGFLGLGAQPPMPEWGAMVSDGRTTFPEWWWNATFPGMAIFVAALAFNLLGDGVRDLLDPRTGR